MSKEYQQIVALVDRLNQEEVRNLKEHLDFLDDYNQNNTEIEISEEEKKLIRERVRMIDEGKAEMISWEEVKKQVFKA